MFEIARQGEAVLSALEADGPLADWVAEVAERIQSGEASEVEAFAAERPDLAEGLRRFFPMIAALAGPGPIELSDFRIVREIGRGGMGVVYEAEQLSLGRRVALKTIRDESAGDPGWVRRFLNEARSAAGLGQHEHIVTVYAAGTERGVPYYAMQLIEGRTLADVVASGPRPTPRAVARWGVQAARALQIAHEGGVIHRDVKPSNLLVDIRDHLRVADFGLAHLSHDTESSSTPPRDGTRPLPTGAGRLTATGALVGTLRYVAPEQIDADLGAIDARTDVYGLGGTLYELLTGLPAFEGTDVLDLTRRIVDEPPRPLRRIDRTIPSDLETIVMTAMEKSPAGRYGTARELAEDLDNFLELRPIRSRRPGTLDHVSKWVRRHWTAVATAAVILLAGVIGLGASVAWRLDFLRRHDRAMKSVQNLANRRERETEQYRYGLKLRPAQQAWESGQVELAQRLLEGLRPEPGRYDPRGFEWSYLRGLYRRDVSYLPGHPSGIQALAISREGRTLASSDATGLLILWDLERWRERGRARTNPITSLWLSLDGAILVSITRSETRLIEIRFWDVASAREMGRFDLFADDVVHGVDVLEVAFSSDGHILTVPEPWWKPVDSIVTSSKITFLDMTRRPPQTTHEQPVIRGARAGISTEGGLFALLDSSGVMTVREGATGRISSTVPGRFPDLVMMTPSRDGRTLAAIPSGTWTLTFWDLVSGQKLGSCASSKGGRWIFSSDGKRFLESWWYNHGEIRLHDIASQRRPILVPLEGISGEAWDSNFSPDGKLLATGGVDLPATLWDSATGKRVTTFPEKTDTVRQVVFTPDGQSLIFGTEDGRIRSWHFGRRDEPTVSLAGHAAEVWALAFTRDGSTLISAGDDRSIKLWDARDGQHLATLDGHESLVTSLAVSLDGATLASASFDGTVRLWDLPGGRPRAVLRGHTDRVRAVKFSPDGRTIASAGRDKTIRLWDAASGKPLPIFEGHEEGITALAFNCDGSLLASASNDRTVRVWDIAGAREPIVLQGLKPIMAVAFSPDGEAIVGGDDSGNLTIWDVATWEPRLSIKGADVAVWGLAFSPDGRTVAAACGDAKVRLWDPLTGQVTLVLDGHAQRVNAVAFSPDGGTLASASHDGAVKLWKGGPP